MSAPTYSIIIPCLNSARTVGASIRSCLQQTFGDFEIIIVNDVRSTDNLQMVVAACDDPRIKIIEGTKPTAAASRNRGVDVARGRYVAFLDSDDAFVPDKLESVLKHVEAAGENVVYSQVYVDRGVGKWWVKPSRGLAEDEDILDYLFAERGWIPPSTVVLSRELAAECKFDEGLLFGDDQQYATDLWRRGARLTMVERPLVIYDDRPSPARLSQSPVYRRRRAAEHVAFVAWVETQKAHMSQRACEACYARFVSRFVVGEAPFEAWSYIWTAYRHGTFTSAQAAMQCVQTYTPRLYRRLSDLVARLEGTEPPRALVRADH